MNDTIPQEHSLGIELFLKSPSGNTFIQALKDRRPDIGKAATIEEQAMVSREARGWEACIAEMQSLAQERPIEPLGNGSYMDMTEKPKTE